MKATNEATRRAGREAEYIAQGVNKVIALDVDSTLWPFHEWMSAALEEVSGRPLEYEEWAKWDVFGEHYTQEQIRSAFARTLDPARVAHREPYFCAGEAVSAMEREGVNFHILTHNVRPDVMQAPLEQWIARHISPAAPVTVLHPRESKVEWMDNVGGFSGIVDDKPDTIREAVEAGYFAATMLHPWNRAAVKDAPAWFFHEWTEFPLIAAASGLEGWES